MIVNGCCNGWVITSQDASFGRHSFQSTNFDMSRKQNSIDSMGFRKTVFNIITVVIIVHCTQHFIQLMWCSSITRSIFVWHFMWIKHAFSIIFAPPHTTCFESFGCYFALSRDSCYSRDAFRFIWCKHIYIVWFTDCIRLKCAFREILALF